MWLAQHKIAIGVVTGLEYLHMIHMPPLVHRDLKPANVLLDHDIEAQTANFRIAKSTPGANTRITSSNVAGTLGWLEYFHTSHTPPLVHRDLKPANVLLDDDMEAWIDDFGIAKSTSDANIHHNQSIKREELAFLDDDDDDAVAGLTVIRRGGCGAVELAVEDTKDPNKKFRQFDPKSKRSLQDILQQVQAEERQLVWLARHKIVIGVVSRIEYLPMSHTPPLVHRDLKPTNVLLDDDMEAWIDDFGIAKLTSDANIHHKFKFCGNIRMYCAPVSSNN
ncbi:leucine-rich repeat receptor-like serine/threonine/tyrosine-protein kinase SOBIR1 [Tanacetum coccineum]